MARSEAHLGWLLLIIAAAVELVICVLVLLALFRRRDYGLGLYRGTGTGVRWITIGGVLVPVIILAAVFIVNLFTLRAVATPPPSPDLLTITVTGHQWWWEVQYPADGPGEAFATANEIHIPVGRKVRFQLQTADVIHSFWVPRLGGKTDLIPGQRNVTWLEADRAGVYRGQCAEYCGAQHGHMAFVVVAQSPDEFAEWEAGQRRPAAAPTDPVALLGRRVFENGPCVVCHTIRGTGAQGTVGPDLTHLASRRTIAAGTIPNTRGYLAGWVANSQGIKPGNKMPPMALAPQELQAVITYLQSLQ